MFEMLFILKVNQLYEGHPSLYKPIQSPVLNRSLDQGFFLSSIPMTVLPFPEQSMRTRRIISLEVVTDLDPSTSLHVVTLFHHCSRLSLSLLLHDAFLFVGMLC